MTWRIDWDEEFPLDQLAGYLADDPDGVHDVLAAVDELAVEPYPPYASTIGHQHRARVGRYRIVYEVDDDTATITVTHIGRTGHR